MSDLESHLAKKCIRDYCNQECKLPAFPAVSHAYNLRNSWNSWERQDRLGGPFWDLRTGLEYSFSFLFLLPSELPVLRALSLDDPIHLFPELQVKSRSGTLANRCLLTKILYSNVPIRHEKSKLYPQPHHCVYAEPKMVMVVLLTNQYEKPVVYLFIGNQG